MFRILRPLAVLCVALVLPAVAAAQNPIQWGGNARTAIDHARQQSMPLMFWVTDWNSAGVLTGNDLANAQEEAFRDPTVVALSRRFVPVRVSRNSRVIEEARELGLPTEFGRFIAIISPDGKLIEEIGPGQVATPSQLADRMAAAYRKFTAELYESTLRPVIINREASKADVRSAVQTVWRLGITAADVDIIALLDRPDVTTAERGRLYGLLASFSTKASVETLLERASKGDRDAAQALSRAEPAAIEWLLPELPTSEGPGVTARQLAAYNAMTRIASTGMTRSEQFWQSAGSPRDRAFELDRLHSQASAVLARWKDTEGKFR